MWINAILSILGVRAFENLTILLEEMKPSALLLEKYTEDILNNISDCISASAQYYQSNFVYNLDNETDVRTHNIDWLVSDSKNVKFQSYKDIDCSQTCSFCEMAPKICMVLSKLCSALASMVDSQQVEIWRYTINSSEKCILEYRNFIIRNKQSDIDWGRYLSIETPEAATLIIDFAMNKMPVGAR